MTDISIRPAVPTSPAAIALFAVLDAFQSDLYPPACVHLAEKTRKLLTSHFPVVTLSPTNLSRKHFHFRDWARLTRRAE
jgi:hypothetical protein